MTNARRVFVFGGSNSLLRGGWVDRLADLAGDQFTLINRSIGSATTLMGIYRLLTTSDIRPGDIALWEYAINDSVHMKDGAPMPVLLENIRWFLQLCAERGMAVLPVVMPTKGQIQRPDPDRYEKGLRRLLDHAAIPYYDCAKVTRSLGGKNPARLFRDQVHFDLDGDITSRFAADILARLQDPSFDRPLAPGLFPALQGRRLTVQDSFAESPGAAFGNSLVSGHLHPPGQTLGLTAKGFLKAALVLATRDGSAVMLQSAGNDLGPFSLCCQVPDEKARMFQLKHLVPEFQHHPRRIPLGQNLAFLPAPAGLGFRPATGFEQPCRKHDPRTGLVALLIETWESPPSGKDAVLKERKLRRPGLAVRFKQQLRESLRSAKRWLRKKVRGK
jgi:hypothetical protein